jgi:hypothetical protein
MQWHGPIKPISVRLPEDLHREIKSIAPKRGLTLEECYADALTQWLEKSGNKVTPIRDEVLDETHRRIVEFFDQATGPRATAGDSTIARLVLDRLGIGRDLKRKGGK